jgi:hypothetical protein
MKNVLLFLLSLVLITSVVEAKIVNDSVYQIPKTSVAPVIDGLQDQIWKALDWNMQRIYNVGDPPNYVDAFGVSGATAADSGVGLTGMSKAMWDANNLYILFYSVDDIIIDVPANPSWNQDAIEIYIDGTNNHTTETSLATGQYQFTIPHWLKGQEATSIGAAFGTTIDTVGIEYKISDVGDTLGFPGWMLEVKIPLASLGIDGSSTDIPIGWELQQDESDDATAGRQAMSKWWSNSNNSWANAGIWGNAVLSSRAVDTVFEINKINSSITIDGVMDPIYQKANSVTVNLFRVGDPPTAESPVVDTDPMFGSFITATPIYDETNLYVFVDVVDQIIMDVPANPSWNQDAVELYLDGTNNHADETSLATGQYQFTIPHWLMGQEATSIGAAFGTTIDTTGIEYKMVNHDAIANNGVITEEGAGYYLELKIPLASLGIDGTSMGAGLGFELQKDQSNDATVGRGGMEKWWNASNNSWANAGLWGYAKLGPLIIGGVKGKPSVAGSYKLDQNYPNPFNPSTKINFELAKTEKVRLTVYNILGEQVAVLVDGMRNAGAQTVTFDAKNFSSGVYFYKLQAGNTMLTKKMMLIK